MFEEIHVINAGAAEDENVPNDNKTNKLVRWPILLILLDTVSPQLRLPFNTL